MYLFRGEEQSRHTLVLVGQNWIWFPLLKLLLDSDTINSSGHCLRNASRLKCQSIKQFASPLIEKIHFTGAEEAGVTILVLVQRELFSRARRSSIAV